MNPGNRTRRAPSRWSATLALLMFVSLLCLGGVLFSPVLIAQGGTRMVPVSLQSKLLADYSAEKFALAVPGVGLDLIGSAIQDQISATDAPLRLSTVISDLQTAVPTVTPQYPQPPNEATPTRVVLPTRRAPATATSAPERPTSVPPVVTSSPVPSATPTRRPTDPPTQGPPTPIPATREPPTQAPPTPVPPTSVPPTAVPPTSVPYPPPPTDPPPPDPTQPPDPTELPYP